MRFFICKDKSKFTKDWNIENFGDWYFIRENDVELFEGENFIVLYSGYLIDDDIHEVCKNFSFKKANGNFFAVKLTKDNYELALDYFQNHKLFIGNKHGIEITNYLSYMTIKKEDIVRTSVKPDQYERELSEAERTTYYDKIFIFDPDYDYVQDAKNAFAQEIWHDQAELTEYIHGCMKQHADIIKEKYPVRMCSLSEGFDSAVQGQFFKDDRQLLYIVEPCVSAENHKNYIKLAQKQFPDTHVMIYKTQDNRQNCLDHLTDSSCRWQSVMPTLMQVKMQDIKPDIIMYGSNGNEMFCRDLIPHMLFLCLQYYNTDKLKMKEDFLTDIRNKNNLYGSTYSILNPEEDQNSHHGFTAIVNKFVDKWFGSPNAHYLSHKKYEEFEDELINLTTPKLYTRVITGNINIMASSLYSDRKIFYEFLKSDNNVLSGTAMNAPTQRALLDKYNYKFTTPRNDIVFADYSELYNTSYEATIDHDLEQNI